jgi:hypothetical protein
VKNNYLLSREVEKYVFSDRGREGDNMAVLRIRIEKMRMRIQEKISMRMRIRIRMRIHALTELWLASESIRNL